MTPSISFHFHFGAESSGVAASTAVSDTLPTPMSFAAVTGTANAQGADALPTPVAQVVLSVGTGDPAAPAPSPMLSVAAGDILAGLAPASGDLPTPFATGGFSVTSESLPSNVPTPFDTPAGINLTVNPVPTPPADSGYADRDSHDAPQPEEGADQAE
jgi:hypothetical protein